MKKITLIAMLLGLVILLAPVQAALASEVTGTLSTDSSQTTVNAPPQSDRQNSQGAMEWDGEMIIKVILISLVLLEILVLVMLNFRRKKKNVYV